MNSEINGRRYQPICRTVVPSFFFSSCPTPALSPRRIPSSPLYRARAGTSGVSSELAGYQSSRARLLPLLPLADLASLTYENTLSGR